jgi:hypothetical protein
MISSEYFVENGIEEWGERFDDMQENINGEK